jgi:hypothetical protein
VTRRWAAFLAVFPLLAAPLLAQAPELQPGIPVVQYVDIIRQDVADTNETGFAARTANALHVRTRERVVEREVLLRPGMPYDAALAAETARNLRALGIFRDVLVDTVRSDSGLTLRVVTKDGWSTFPIFDITTAAGQSAVARRSRGQPAGLAATRLVRYSGNPIARRGSSRSGSRACSAGASVSACRWRNARTALHRRPGGTPVLLLSSRWALRAMPSTSMATCWSSPMASSRRSR